MVDNNVEYFTISPLLIFEKTLGRFPVYLKHDDRYILYCSPKEHFTRKHKERLYEMGVKNVYVKVDDKSKFEAYLENNLGTILEDDKIEIEERSKIFYNVSEDILKDSLDENLPMLSGKSFDRVMGLIDNAMDFVKNEESIKAMAKLISGDYKTYTHCVNVFMYTVSVLTISEAFSDDFIKHMGIGAMLHDIGKAQVPKKVLNKKGKLTPEEFDIIKKHSVYGYTMCKDLPLSKISKACILYHHERADGTGYPRGLNLGQIPEGVNVITLADVYDAITSERPYAKKQTPYEALDTMVNHMKNFFDPKWLKFFIQMLHNIEAVEKIKPKEIDKDKYNIDKHIEW